MDFELVRCQEGQPWFPWNYGRSSASGRVGVNRFLHEPGLVVLNAVSPSGRILGSCAMRIGYRHSEYLLSDEEYQYGAAAAGPPYFWTDTAACPWILILKSLWVRPGQRRNGIARHFAVYVRDLGLPTYLAFANKHVAAWFNREFRPSDQPSRVQEGIATAMRAPGATFEPSRRPDFTVFVQAEASALRLWRAWPESSSEVSGLDRVLGFPVRADIWTIDGGEAFEAGFSDSAFAEDRQFGYTLQPWWDAWGPAQGPFDGMGDDPYDEDYEDAEAAFATQPSFTAGSADGWVIDPDAMCAYATVRRFLRTLAWHDYNDVDDAARELFVRDLRDEPRGLRGFSALVTPAGQASA